jgi:hypothetical protein
VIITRPDGTTKLIRIGDATMGLVVAKIEIDAIDVEDLSRGVESQTVRGNNAFWFQVLSTRMVGPRPKRR